MTCLSARLLTVLAVLLLGACAATTELLRTVDEAAPPRTARSLLVVGISNDNALRQRYEAVFVEELQRAGIAGTGSTALIPSLAGMTMPELRARMAAAGGLADAVIHVQLVDLVTTPAWAPDDVPADAAPATRNIGGINLTLNAPPAGSRPGTHTGVDLEANLYALPERTLLWTALTRTQEANDIDKVARSHARALIQAMVARGLLAPAR